MSETTLTTEILDRLIAFPTISADSNLEIVDYIQDFLTERGFAVSRVPDATGQKAGLFASIGPSDTPGVLLSGHTDVVPAAGQNWTRDPFRLGRDGARLYGRGTTDMKGYLASMMVAADAASQSALKEPLKLAFSYDEEVGCVGIQSMIGDLERSIGLPRACLVGEPTEMQIAVGHKGKLAFQVECIGTNGHSALAPKFLNALHLGADFISGLRRVQTGLEQSGARDAAYDIPYSTVHAGKMSGGTALNIVPDKAVVDFEIRHLAEDTPDQILADIDRMVASCVERVKPDFPEADIRISRKTAYPGLNVREEDEIVATAQAWGQTSGSTKVAFGTEAGFFAGLGIPTVVCGPGSMDGQGHKPDEYIEIAQLDACDRMLARVLDDLKV